MKKLTAWLKLSFPFVFWCQNTLRTTNLKCLSCVFAYIRGNMTCKAHNIRHTQSKHMHTWYLLVIYDFLFLKIFHYSWILCTFPSVYGSSSVACCVYLTYFTKGKLFIFLPIQPMCVVRSNLLECIFNIVSYIQQGNYRKNKRPNRKLLATQKYYTLPVNLDSINILLATLRTSIRHTKGTTFTYKYNTQKNSNGSCS